MTPDEVTILMIAAEGQSMLAIGRWKPAVESLSLLGLLKKLDPFNFVITDLGRKALETVNQADDKDFRTAHGEYTETENFRTQMLQSAEQAALHLSYAARAASNLNGLTPNQSAWEISQQVLQRALTLLEDTSDRSHQH